MIKMTAVEEKITIKYKTRKDYCPCCQRDLDEPSLSKIREFDFTKRSFQDYGAHWELYDGEEMKEVVREFVYETIDFFAVTNHEPILLEKGEMERMYEFARKCFAK
ncbi:hypothetical protein QT711_03440 [Sporosarcina saromensis]|uniref:Uncharacterized protein n=1 Tax=Sporosarcina saromensis TaxID=359365 RepID=A0ABU4G5K6_9BACL|nr:hypothetical protein [Sporosarcina saromensis]MDW0112224.1 hypothetical protein [Sporosarcina saromensis]